MALLDSELNGIPRVWGADLSPFSDVTLITKTRVVHFSARIGNPNIVYSLDASADRFFYLERGIAIALFNSPDGNTSADLIKAPGILGEEFFAGVSNFRGETRVLTDCRLREVDKHTYKKLSEQFPGLRTGIDALLARQTIRARDRLALAVKTVPAALAWQLIDLSDGPPNWEVPIISHQDLGALIVRRREAASRALMTLREEGLIRRFARTIEIADPKRLRNLAERDRF